MALLRREPIVAVAAAPAAGTVERIRATGQGWQSEAWSVWHDLGEVHYPTSQIARLVSRVTWRTEPETDLDELFAVPGVGEVSRLIALNLEVAGEGWLIFTERDARNKPIEPRWEVLPVNVSGLQQRLDTATIKVRFWNPDPEDPQAADSSVRAALGPANELLTLQALSRSQARNRLATAGILLRPNTKKPMVDENGVPVDFTDLLQAAMTAAIQDEDSAAAVVPLDITLPADEIEHWKHLIFERPYDEHVDQKMERCIKRIALALDIWPELLLGIADVNHWNAWFLAEDTWQGHIAPLAEQVAGTMEVAAAELDIIVRIEADPTELLARRSSVRDAIDVARIGGVSLEFVRTAIGADDDDAPTPTDLETIALMLGHLSNEQEEEEVLVEENPGPPDTQEDSQQPITAAAGDLVDGLGVDLARIDDQLRGWLEGSAEAAIDLARSRVGMQVRAKLRSDPRAQTIDGVPNSEVVHVLGYETTAEILDVTATITQTVTPLTHRWATRLKNAERAVTALIGPVVPPEQWETARQNSVELLLDEVVSFVDATLERSDTEMVTFDGRRIVEAAGV